MTTHEHPDYHNVETLLVETPTPSVEPTASTPKPTPSVTIRLTHNQLFALAMTVIAVVAVVQTVQITSLQRAIKSVNAAPTSTASTNTETPAALSTSSIPQGGSAIPDMVGGC